MRRGHSLILIGVFVPASVFAGDSFDPDLKYAQVGAVEIPEDIDSILVRARCNLHSE
ncbi:MAG: hypothetical protein ACOCYA_06720 [Spirochaetota bacterium]